MYPIRSCKIAMVASVALFVALVVFNNVTDYDSNLVFVQHVLMMDTIFSDSNGKWRAIASPILHHAVYVGIIFVEAIIALLCWIGAVKLFKVLDRGADEFNLAKDIAVVGLTLGFCFWFIGFIAIGGEWFLMWQSEDWNGQQAAFRIAVLIGISMVFLYLPDSE